MHTEVARVVESTEHKDFNWVNLSNDVTILYLERNSLNLGELFPLVGKVCLPHEEEFLQGGKKYVNSYIIQQFGLVVVNSSIVHMYILCIL